MAHQPLTSSPSSSSFFYYPKEFPPFTLGGHRDLDLLPLLPPLPPYYSVVPSPSLNWYSSSHTLRAHCLSLLTNAPITRLGWAPFPLPLFFPSVFFAYSQRFSSVCPLRLASVVHLLFTASPTRDRVNISSFPPTTTTETSPTRSLHVITGRLLAPYCTLFGSPSIATSSPDTQLPPPPQNLPPACPSSRDFSFQTKSCLFVSPRRLTDSTPRCFL